MTQKGWGLEGPKRDPEDSSSTNEEGFMERYLKGEFLARRALFGYNREKEPTGFAFVMRSMRVMCVDIDGKNGGLEFAPTLGNLPYTLSETSKSGTGYHLYYEVDESWDDVLGYGTLPDQIGIVQGVDIRSVGCVYHWHSQKWNTRDVAPLPDWLRDRMLERHQQRLAATAKIVNAIQSQDPEEIMLMQAELLAELAKPIQAGKRNNSLFAMGVKLKNAGIPKWDEHIERRAVQVGLDAGEISKLIANLHRQ